MDDRTPLLNGVSPNNSPTSSHTRREIDHVETVSTHPRKLGFTCSLAFAISACILGSSFQYGFNAGVVNSPVDVIKDFYNKTYEKRTGEPISESLLTLLWAVTVSSYCIGGMIGGISAGFWANKYGRRGALLRNNLVAVVAAGLLGFSKMAYSYEMLIAGRIISGINAGINTGVGPLYLSEIAPTSLRGLCGTFNQLAITFGVLVAEIMGLDIALGTESLWPILVGFTIVPVIFQLLTLTYCPETPQFLMVALKEEDEAEKALTWLRGTEDVGEEMEELRKRMEHHDTVRFTVPDLFRNADLRWPLIICIVLNLAQQFSGINAVIYYSTSIFMKAGLSKLASEYATVGTGAVNVTMTFFSALIMDRLGRRRLMLIGLSGLLLFSTVLSVALIFQNAVPWLSYLCIVAVIFYIVAFAAGPGSIPWFYVAELFTEKPRNAAVSISVLVNWLANFIVGLSYPELQSAIHAYSFLPFVLILLCSLVFTAFFVPETKGKRIEDIVLLFKTPKMYQDPDSNLLRTEETSVQTVYS